MLQQSKQAALEQLLTSVKDQDLAEAVMVRLAYKFGLNMFGRQMNDRISTTAHAKSIQVHPYPWFAAGAAGILVHQDATLGVQVVLVKQKRRPNAWHLPGGYAMAAPLAGGEQGLDLLTQHYKDAAEAGVLKGDPDPYLEIAKKYKIDYSDPLWHTPRSWDSDLVACVKRELHEELGIELTVIPELVLQQVQYHPKAKIHVIDNTYLINLGSEHLKLMPDLVEIAAAIWIPINKIQQDPSTTVFSYQDLEMPLQVAEKINAAIKQWRSNQFVLGSKNVFLKLAAILDLALPSQHTIAWEFYNDAYELQQQLLQLEQLLLAKIGTVK